MSDHSQETLVVITEKTVQKYKQYNIIDKISLEISSSINIIKSTDQNRLRRICLEAAQQSIVLIGGHKTLPFFSVQNPVSDSDSAVYSDLPYVSKEASRFLVPDKKICRIPDDDSDITTDFLFKVLNNNKDIKIDKKYNMSNYGAKSWEHILKEVEKTFKTDPVETCPPQNKDIIREKFTKDKNIIYFNLHGVMSKGELYGQNGREFPPAFSTNNICNNNNGIAIITSCYGGYIINRRVDTSVPLSLLYNGFAGVFCSTSISYGTARPPLILTDNLINLFLTSLLKGDDFTTALFNAKKEYLVNVVSTKGRVINEDKKTLLQFNIYGNPYATIKYNDGSNIIK